MGSEVARAWVSTCSAPVEGRSATPASEPPGLGLRRPVTPNTVNNPMFHHRARRMSRSRSSSTTARDPS